MNTSSINEHYSEDHDRLDEIFHQFQRLKRSDSVKASASFHEFRAGLERHIVWEEGILFPAFEEKFGNFAGPTHVMRSEHREIRKHLEGIGDKLARGDYETELEEMALQAVLCPHNQKEEGVLYPMLDQVTDAEERAGIFCRMHSGAF